jgi:hypothetical protein
MYIHTRCHHVSKILYTFAKALSCSYIHSVRHRHRHRHHHNELGLLPLGWRLFWFDAPGRGGYEPKLRIRSWIEGDTPT